jgi:hypothetical protein
VPNDNRLRFNGGLPDGCPLPGAEGTTRRVFRAIRNRTPELKDFYSVAELSRYEPGSGTCEHWGLSAWVTLDDARHAKTIIKGFDKKAVVGFDVIPSDGVILHTPSDAQPGHHTFWKVVDVDLCPRCTIEINRTVL